MNSLSGMDIVELSGKKVGVALVYGNTKLIVTTNLFGKFRILDAHSISLKAVYRTKAYLGNNVKYNAQESVLRAIRTKGLSKVLRATGLRGPKTILFSILMTYGSGAYDVEKRVNINTIRESLERVVITND